MDRVAISATTCSPIKVGVRKPTATGTPTLDEIGDSASLVLDKSDITLSFDLSTRSIGWALGSSGELVSYGKYVYKSTAHIGAKLEAFAALVERLIDTYTPDRLVLEQPDPRARTRSHHELLGVLRLIWQQYKGEEIPKDHLINARKAKKHLHVEPTKDHAENKRRMVLKINQMFSLNLAFHPNSPRQSDDDIADAIAILVTSWRLFGTNA